MIEHGNASSRPIVSLREVTAETVRAICNLSVHPGQTRCVAPNAVSIAQAYFEPKAWFRAIYADETPVGFVMLYDDADNKEYFLWRLMIASNEQGKGYGKQAVELLIDQVRTRPGAEHLGVSCVQNDGPLEFYRKLGFRETGEVEGDEVILRLQLQ